jgi:hypothetical protein
MTYLLLINEYTAAMAHLKIKIGITFSNSKTVCPRYVFTVR